MRREEFMAQLASLLQDISAEERLEAMQYYNDYFDDAGKDQEEIIIEQLGSPEKVAAEVKAGLHPQDEEAAEYRETGYTDTRFEQRETPASKGQTQEKKPWTNKTLKSILIILVIIAAVPILGPIIVGILSAVLGIVIAIVATFGALVIAAAAIAIAGFGVLVAGGVTLFTSTASGLLVAGVGLILLSLGAVATVASVKLCIVVFPGIIRGVVSLGRKIFRKDKVVA